MHNLATLNKNMLTNFLKNTPSLNKHGLIGNQFDDSGITRLDELGIGFEGLTGTTVNLFIDFVKFAGRISWTIICLWTVWINTPILNKLYQYGYGSQVEMLIPKDRQKIRKEGHGSKNNKHEFVRKNWEICKEGVVAKLCINEKIMLHFYLMSIRNPQISNGIFLKSQCCQHLIFCSTALQWPNQ